MGPSSAGASCRAVEAARSEEVAEEGDMLPKFEELSELECSSLITVRLPASVAFLRRVLIRMRCLKRAVGSAPKS